MLTEPVFSAETIGAIQSKVNFAIIPEMQNNGHQYWQADIGSWALNQLTFNNYSDSGVTTGDGDIMLKLEIFYHNNQ